METPVLSVASSGCLQSCCLAECLERIRFTKWGTVLFAMKHLALGKGRKNENAYLRAQKEL